MTWTPTLAEVRAWDAAHAELLARGVDDLQARADFAAGPFGLPAELVAELVQYAAWKRGEGPALPRDRQSYWQALDDRLLWPCREAYERYREDPTPAHRQAFEAAAERIHANLHAWALRRLIITCEDDDNAFRA